MFVNISILHHKTFVSTPQINRTKRRNRQVYTVNLTSTNCDIYYNCSLVLNESWNVQWKYKYFLQRVQRVLCRLLLFKLVTVCMFSLVVIQKWIEFIVYDDSIILHTPIKKYFSVNIIPIFVVIFDFYNFYFVWRRHIFAF